MHKIENKKQKDFISRYGTISYIATLRSMLSFNEGNTLVEIKAIDKEYPLLGDLSFNENISREKIFSENGIAVDKVLLSQMARQLFTWIIPIILSCQQVLLVSLDVVENL